MGWHRPALLLLTTIEAVARDGRRVCLRIFLFDFQRLRLAQLVDLAKFFKDLDFGNNEDSAYSQYKVWKSGQDSLLLLDVVRLVAKQLDHISALQLALVDD